MTFMYSTFIAFSQYQKKHAFSLNKGECATNSSNPSI